MAGSHEVRGSIPLGSTTDTRGARRRRRAPLFCFRAHRTERAYRTKSVSHSGAPARAGAPFSFARTRRPIQAPGRKARPRRPWASRGRGARACAAREEAAPDPFGRIEAIRNRAGTHSALGRLGPAELEGADWPREDRRPKAAQKPSTESGRFGFGGGFANPGIGGLPEAPDVRRPLSRGGGPRDDAAIEPASRTPKKGPIYRRASAGLGRPRREPDPRARRRLIYEMAGMPTISLPASLGRLPKQRPKWANRGEWPAPLPMRRKKRRERRNLYLANP